MSIDNTLSLRDRVAAIQWWHRIDLGGGIITPGQDHTFTKVAALHLPEDLTGRTVIDIGALSFECERRKARRVLATDHFIWELRGHARFDVSARGAALSGGT